MNQDLAFIQSLVDSHQEPKAEETSDSDDSDSDSDSPSEGGEGDEAAVGATADAAVAETATAADGSSRVSPRAHSCARGNASI